MEALSLLLNIVYENVFLSNSHGFRRGRAPKLALAFFRIWIGFFGILVKYLTVLENNIQKKPAYM